MSHTENLIERNGYRAVLTLDETPHPPEDCGAVPQFTAYYQHGWKVGCEQNASDLPDEAQKLLNAWDELTSRHGSDKGDELFARWCHIVYGVDYVRITDHHGYSQGDEIKLFEIAGVAWLDGIGWEKSKAEFAEMHESYKERPELVSYVFGDVWGIVVEKVTRYVNEDDPDDVVESWVEVESCWGYYGESDTPYFLEEAESMLSAQLPRETTPKAISVSDLLDKLDGE